MIQSRLARPMLHFSRRTAVLPAYTDCKWARSGSFIGWQFESCQSWFVRRDSSHVDLMRAFCAAPKCRDNDVANCDEFGLALVLSFTTAHIINGTWVLVFDEFLDLGHVSLVHHRLDDVARRVNARQSCSWRRRHWSCWCLPCCWFSS